MGKLQPTGTGHIELMDGTRRVWSSDGRPVNLLPQSNWKTLPITVNFPDFIKRNAYGLGALNGGPFPNNVCMSMATIIPQEWGPGEPSARRLSDATLMTVPDDVNFIDVRITVMRTKTPDQILGRPFTTNTLSTKEVFLPGGSAVCEMTPLWRRMFSIELSGSAVLLRRWQSTIPGMFNAWTPGNAVYSGSGGKLSGFTHGGGSGSDKGNPAYIIQTKVGGNVNKERGGSNACSLNDPSDFSSTYAGTVVIRPGYLAS